MGLLTLPDRRIRQPVLVAPLQAPWVRALHVGRDTLTGFAPRIGAKAANRYGLGNKIVMSDTAEQVDLRIPTTPKFSMLLVGTFDAYTLDYPYFMQPNPAGSGLTLRHEGTGNRAVFYDGPTSTAVDSGLLFPLGDQFVLGLTYDGTKYRWYKNGADGNTITAAFNPSGNWFYVSLTGKGNTHTSVLHAFANAALPPAKMRELTVNPWGVFAPSRGLGGVPSSASSLSGSATGGATAGGAANLSAQVALAGVGVATAGGSAVGSVAVPLSATGLSVAGGSAGITATVSISAAGLAQAAGTAGLSAAVLLAGAGAAQASGNATLAAQLSAMASGAAQAGGSANLSGGAQGAISASGGAVSGGSAVLNVTVQLAAMGGSVAGGSANLSGGSQGAIAASGVAVAGGSGTLSVTVALTAAGFAQAMGTGMLVVVMSTRTMAARRGWPLSSDSFARPESLSTGRRSWR